MELKIFKDITLDENLLSMINPQFWMDAMQRKAKFEAEFHAKAAEWERDMSAYLDSIEVDKISGRQLYIARTWDNKFHIHVIYNHIIRVRASGFQAAKATKAFAEYLQFNN